MHVQSSVNFELISKEYAESPIQRRFRTGPGLGSDDIITELASVTVNYWYCSNLFFWKGNGVNFFFL